MKLNGLEGILKTKEILMLLVKCKSGPDVYIWKPNINGKISTASACEVIRTKGKQIKLVDGLGMTQTSSKRSVNL